MATNSQVCFHRWLFANPVKPHWCITGPVGPLESTNQNWLGANLLLMAILVYPVVCVHPSHLLGAQNHCLCPNGRESPHSACPSTPTALPPPTPLSPTHPLIHDTCDITGIVKTISKTSSK